MFTTTRIISELLLLATRITTRSIDPSTASYYTCCHSYLVFLLLADTAIATTAEFSYDCRLSHPAPLTNTTSTASSYCHQHVTHIILSIPLTLTAVLHLLCINLYILSTAISIKLWTCLHIVLHTILIFIHL